MAEAVAAIPAATVIPLRDGADGLETLLLRRNASLAFAGGHWVFPGGRVDADELAAHPDDPAAAARAAAVREANEEAGLVLDPAALVPFSHWTPPPQSPKRFATWFFATAVLDPDVTVAIDGGEIHEHVWIRPTDAMVRRDAAEIELSPPTWITLEQLARYPTSATAIAGAAATDPEHFATRIADAGGQLVALYHGDAGYEDSDPSREGPRHRLWMADAGWRYERD